MKRLLDSMYEYQKKNNIKNKCAINSVIVCDHLRVLGISHKLIIGFVTCYMNPKGAIPIQKQEIPITNQKIPAINVHCWIDTCNGVIDPSWDMYSQQNTIYFPTISKLTQDKSVNMYIKAYPQNYKEMIAHYIDFSKEMQHFLKTGAIHKDETYYNNIMKYYQRKTNINTIIRL